MPSLDRAVRRIPADRFVVLLTLLICAYLLNLMSERTAVRVTVVVIYVLALVVGLATSRPSRRLLRLGVWVAAVSMLAAGAVAASLPPGRGWGALNAGAVVVLLVTLVAVVSRVLSHRDVTWQTLAGALSAYLLIGLMFAAIFALVAVLTPGDFFTGGQRPTPELLQYFSLTTLTTLGYGDLTAASAQGRGLAAFEALAGQVFLATLVASLVGAFGDQRRRRTSHPED